MRLRRKMHDIYLDNAATSYPKPEAVWAGMQRYMEENGAPLGRSGYPSAVDVLQTALLLREELSHLFRHGGDASHVVLTPGATASLNMVLKGYLRPGDHCITTVMEHNAVLRPLHQLEGMGVTVDKLPADSTGLVDADVLASLIRPNTRLIIMTHASNVNGALQPVEYVGRAAMDHGIPFVLDAAQTAGHYPIDFTKLGLSALAVPGHKGLLGPSGIGALLLTEEFASGLNPLIAGGTGSMSDSEEMPPYMPDKLEAGTLNIPGIYGLLYAAAYVSHETPALIHQHEMALTKRLMDGLFDLPGIRMPGPAGTADRVGVVAVAFERDNAEIADELAQQGVLVRCGLQCAPGAHRALGTFPTGTVRFSMGYFNTAEEIDETLHILRGILTQRK